MSSETNLFKCTLLTESLVLLPTLPFTVKCCCCAVILKYKEEVLQTHINLDEHMARLEVYSTSVKKEYLICSSLFDNHIALSIVSLLYPWTPKKDVIYFCYLCQKQIYGENGLNQHKNQHEKKLKDPNLLPGRKSFCSGCLVYVSDLKQHKTSDFHKRVSTEYNLTWVKILFS